MTSTVLSLVIGAATLSQVTQPVDPVNPVPIGPVVPGVSGRCWIPDRDHPTEDNPAATFSCPKGTSCCYGAYYGDGTALVHYDTACCSGGDSCVYQFSNGQISAWCCSSPCTGVH